MRLPPPRMPKVVPTYFPYKGGLDLVTPRIEIEPGRLMDAQNYEPYVVGGYRRINGFERFDGRASPTAASYWVISATITGTLTNGATLTGGTSGATGRILGNFSGNTIVLSRVAGTFVTGEALKVSGVTVATATTAASQRGATMPSDDADYRLLAANDARADILIVPGSGQIRGVFVVNDVVYASRDNAGGTANVLFQATVGGWTQVPLGFEIQFAARTATVTISIATPGVVTWNNHGLSNGQTVVFGTTGALPTGLTAGTTYYVIAAAANTFQLSATSGGSAIATSGTQSGTQTCTLTSASGIIAGQTVTGVTSGASAVASVVLLRSGTWTVSPLGSIVFAAVTGTFQNGEALQVGGVAQAGSTTASAAITRAPGGRLEVAIGNFVSSATTKKAYGVDGVNPCFEFDGATYVPIHTGMTADTPSHVAVHKNKLFLSFLGSVQYSATTNPYGWSVVIGANEIAMGDSVAGMLTQTGNAQGASLAIFTAHRTSILYGSSSSDFNLIASVFELGYVPYTIQPVSNNTYGLTKRGVQALITTLNYGDFNFDALSFLVQSLLDSKYATACASTTLRGNNQYRVYFTDGTGLAFGLTGEDLNGILPLNYGKAVRVIWTSVLSSGAEVTYFGSDDGYVYQDNIGTSFDGSAIEAWCRPVFNNLRSPLTRKRYRRAILESTCDGFAQIQMSYDLGYANPDVTPPSVNLAQNLVGGGGYWDQFVWDSFTWDTAVVQEASLSIDGAENNIGFVFYSNRAQDDPHILQGMQLLWTPRHLVR